MKNVTLLFTFLMIALVKAQTAGEIVQKHIDTIGGEKAWNNISSIQMNAKLNSSKGPVKVMSIHKNGKFIGISKMEGTDIVQFAFDGKTYWGVNFGTMKPEVRNRESMLRAKKGSEDFPNDFIAAKKYGYKVELLGEENIQGQDCYKLQLTKGKIPKNGKEIDDVSISFISKENYLQVLAESDYKKGALETTLYTYYSDYREVGGLLLPFSIDQIIDESHTAIKVDSYDLNGRIDDSIFKFKE